MIRTAYRYLSYLPAGETKQSPTVFKKCSYLYIYTNRRGHYSLCDFVRNRNLLDSTTPVGYLGVRRQFNTREILQREKHLSDSALACRLANENGYLSWCRNSYLLTVVAIGMLSHGTNHYTDLAGYVTFMTAGLNISWGSLVYIYNRVAHRKRVQMSIPITALTVAGVLLNFSLFVCVILVFTADCDPSSLMHRRISSVEVQQQDNESYDF